MSLKTVTVTVDRPLGSFHPDHPDLYYSLNYGYIKGTLAPDGDWQDAYILGINQPVDEFSGQVIAIIRRADDTESKWIVAPQGYTFTAEEIKRLTYFQEKYFQSEIIML